VTTTLIRSFPGHLNLPLRVILAPIRILDLHSCTAGPEPAMPHIVEIVQFVQLHPGGVPHQINAGRRNDGTATTWTCTATMPPRAFNYVATMRASSRRAAAAANASGGSLAFSGIVPVSVESV
jgi:hypothetical protein